MGRCHVTNGNTKCTVAGTTVVEVGYIYWYPISVTPNFSFRDRSSGDTSLYCVVGKAKKARRGRIREHREKDGTRETTGTKHAGIQNRQGKMHPRLCQSAECRLAKKRRGIDKPTADRFVDVDNQWPVCAGLLTQYTDAWREPGAHALRETGCKSWSNHFLNKSSVKVRERQTCSAPRAQREARYSTRRPRSIKGARCRVGGLHRVPFASGRVLAFSPRRPYCQCVVHVTSAGFLHRHALGRYLS